MLRGHDRLPQWALVYGVGVQAHDDDAGRGTTEPDVWCRADRLHRRFDVLHRVELSRHPYA